MNFIQDFAGFVAFFKQIQNQSTYLKFFEHGGTEKIISQRLVSDTRSTISYPLLFLEWPEVPIEGYGGENSQVEFRTGLVVLGQAPNDDWELQNQVMGDTFNAMVQVLAKINAATKGLNKRFFTFDLSKVSIVPLDNLMIDSAYGWRMEFAVTAPLNTCIDPTFWLPEP